jgi:hypothetical protein
MKTTTDKKAHPGRLRKWIRRIALALGGFLLLIGGFVFLTFAFLNRVPKSYPESASPVSPPSREDYARFKLDGFESPYLGHTGSWNGKGGTMFGGTKEKDLAKEVAMGLRWTFMPVNWRALEPDGPVDLANGTPAAWKELDDFVKLAQRHKLNILFQAPVVGGNAQGPPDWAGRRERGKSAPQNMEALAEFVGKLAARYKPGGTLALEAGWGEQFGVRAWELDNEPESYRTHWAGQAGDYAEMATKVAAKIKAADPVALLLLPGIAGGESKAKWLNAAFDTRAISGSPSYRSNAIPYSIGPVADVVSFHVYEGLDSAFAGEPRTVEVVFDEVRSIFERWESNSPEFAYARKREYWHTEGNFDFIGALSEPRRAAWRMQFFTRAFAAGVRKVCVMDAAELEIVAVRAYIAALPWPFPMHRIDREVKVLTGGTNVVAYRHLDGNQPDEGQVWVLWMAPGSTNATIELSAYSPTVTLIRTDGSKIQQEPVGGRVTVELTGDQKMAPPVLFVDRTIRPEDLGLGTAGSFGPVSEK